MLSIWKIHNARRAAKQAIVPLVESSRMRCGAIPDSAWERPYIIGFVATLITLCATRRAGALQADALAAVQSGAWSDITKSPGAFVGERILFLSLAHDAKFLKGCRNAERFFDSFSGLSVEQTDDIERNAEREQQISLWTRYFDRRLSEWEAPVAP